MFKKSFWVPYNNGSVYPSLSETMDSISRYCEENGLSCTFISDDEVEIDGNAYKIYRG